MRTDYLLEWDQLDLRVRGTKVQDLLSDLLRRKRVPVSDLKLKFLDGEMQISARIQKGLQVPVKLTVRKITVSQKTIQVVLEDVATFGIIPIPKLLFELLGSRRLGSGFHFDAKTLTVSVQWDRFLPEFVHVTPESIRIIPGGLAVRLGKGGSDLP